MKVWVLGSGSRGNAVVVESGECRVMIDVGFGPRIPAPPAPELPAAGPTAEPALAPPEAIPGGGAQPSAAPKPDTPEDDL